MKVVALSFVVVLLCFHAADAQTIDDIIQHIFDHSSDCGDPFSDPVWVPALDLCTMGCDTLGEICMEDADLNQRCDPLPEKCTAGLKKKYPNAIGKKTKPHTGSKSGAPGPPATEAPSTGEEKEEGYEQSTVAPAAETTTEATVEETEAPAVESTEAPVEPTEAPVEPTEAPEKPVEPAPAPQPQPAPAPAPAPGGYGGSAGGGSEGARDYHVWCCKWAFEGQCNIRPVLMRPLCQKSCGTHGCRAENALSCPVTVNVSPDTCWQLKGKSGNPDRDPSHFRPQPGADAQPFTITEIGAPVREPLPPPRPKTQPQAPSQSQSYEQPAAPAQPAPAPPSLPSLPSAPAAYEPAAAPQLPPPQPPPLPQPSPESYSEPAPKSEPQAGGGYRRRLLLHRRFLLLRRLRRL